MRRRWLRRVLVALPIVLVTLLLGACASAMYIHTIWEGAFQECGRRAPAPATGWSIAFHGDDDVFVCSYGRNRQGEVLQTRLAPEDYMGTSGSWPIFSEVVAYELEAIDGDQP
jgi:hypothetical protein